MNLLPSLEPPLWLSHKGRGLVSWRFATNFWWSETWLGRSTWYGKMSQGREVDSVTTGFDFVECIFRALWKNLFYSKSSFSTKSQTYRSCPYTAAHRGSQTRPVNRGFWFYRGYFVDSPAKPFYSRKFLLDKITNQQGWSLDNEKETSRCAHPCYICVFYTFMLAVLYSRLRFSFLNMALMSKKSQVGLLIS